MKRTAYAASLPLVVVSLIVACGDSSSPTKPGPAQVQPEGNGDPAPGGDTEVQAAMDVDCAHPGAGKQLGNGRCECTTTRNIAGDWSTLRTCREGDSCPTRDKTDGVVVTQDGTHVKLERAGTYEIDGTLCGDVMIWTGGPKDGLNPECGTIRFTDDAHYTIDSCYVEAGECSRTHAQGCPALKGQCTGTGAKRPDDPAAISKVICL